MGSESVQGGSTRSFPRLNVSHHCYLESLPDVKPQLPQQPFQSDSFYGRSSGDWGVAGKEYCICIDLES